MLFRSGESRDADRERIAAIRATMMTDLRLIVGKNAGHRRTEARGISGSMTIISGRSEQEQFTGNGERDGRAEADHEPRFTTVAGRELFPESQGKEAGAEGRGYSFPPALPTGLTYPERDAVAMSRLAQRAAAAREREPNF